MYGLRLVNNLYAEHTGTRGDFIVVGHPEFNKGKAGTSTGVGRDWDCAFPRCHPRKGPAADRLRRSGTATLVKRLTQDISEIRADRASAKSALLASRAAEETGLAPSSSFSSASGQRRKGHVNDADAFEAFISALTSGERRPALKPSGTPLTIGEQNHMRGSGHCRHYDSMSEELDNLVDRLRREPEQTRRLLNDSGSWRFWAKQLELAQLREGRERHKGRLFKSHTEAALRTVQIEPGRGTPRIG